MRPSQAARVLVAVAPVLLVGCAWLGRGTGHDWLPPLNPWLVENDDRDSDGDGLTDFQEIHKYLTDPFRADSDGDGVPDGAWEERREFAYSIRNVLEVLRPVDLQAMNTDDQDARLVEDRGASVVVEVITYPFSTAHRAIGESRGWQRADGPITRYLTPTRTANWDPPMRAELLAAVRAAGIEPDRLTDRELVKRVSAWVFRTFEPRAPFSGFFVEFTDPIRLRAELRPRLLLDNPGIDVANLQDALELGVLGKRMFDARAYGSCTSSAILLATVLRAVGIPTRIVLAVPAIDANDEAQWAQMRRGITHSPVRDAMAAGLADAQGWASHTFNEVFVAGRWVTLNYARLGQPSLDRRTLGLLVRVNTMVDWSDADLTSTWGLRFAGPDHRDLVPALSSRHAYRSLGISDRFPRYPRDPLGAGPEAAEMRDGSGHLAAAGVASRGAAQHVQQSQ